MKPQRILSVMTAVAMALLATGAGSAAHAADTIKGKQVYERYCSICHGPTGTSVMPGAPNFSRSERLLTPDLTLLASIRAGKNAMPAFRGIITDRDIMDVIAYVRTLH